MSRLDEAAYRSSEQACAETFGVEIAEHAVGVPGTETSIRVLEAGAGDPIVFIHGSPNNAATWISLAAELPDRRCSLEAATLVGSSFGALYAYNFALAHPDRVGGLVVPGSPAGPAVVGMPAIFRLLSLPLPRVLAKRALRPDAEEARKMFREIGHGAAVDRGAIPDVVFEWYSSLLCHTDTAEHLLGEIRAIASPFGYRAAARLDDEALGSIRVPLLYLWGSEDSFGGPDLADDLVKLTHGASIEHFEGFGHLPWYDDTAVIAHRIRAFAS
jgi:pimeloyl-ACP methyl ester carboxylesterase